MTPTPTDLTDLLADHPVTDSRRESLEFAIGQGADPAVLVELRDARRIARFDTVVLPSHHLASLSRGRGWCRRGRGDSAEWAEKTEHGNYRVGPGKWTVGATDGFSRKDSTSWRVQHVRVGDATWTIAN